jgi:hypothetical protein
MNSTSTTTSCSQDFEENDLIYGELNTHDKGSEPEVHLAYEGRWKYEELGQFFKCLN